MKKIICFLSAFLFLMSCDKIINEDSKFSYDLIPVNSGSKWGYIDKEGKFVINPQFKDAFWFKENLALAANQDSLYGYINKKGDFTIPAKYKYATSFENGIALVTRENGFITGIDTKGKELFVLKDAKSARQFSEGLALVQINDKYGYINEKGEFTIKPQFDMAYSFKNGFARIASFEEQGSLPSNYGFIDKNGKIVINQQFDIAADFDDEFASITIGNQGGYIDIHGKIVIKPQFDAYDNYGEHNFKEGLAPIRQGELWGYADNTGKIVISPQFDNASQFSQSLASVKVGKKYGFIDKSGKYIINPQFDEASSFFKNLSIFKSGNKIGLIDKEGKYVINPQFTSSKLPFSDNYSEVYTDFYDSTKLVSKLFSNKKEFFGLSKNTDVLYIVKNFVKLHNLDITKLSSTSIELGNNLKDESSWIVANGVMFQKANFLFNQEIIKKTPTYSQYYDRSRDQSGNESGANKDAKLVAVDFYISLYGDDAYGKEKNIATAIKNEFIKKYNLKSESGYPGYYSLSNKDISVNIDSNSGGIHVYILFDNSGASDV